MGPWDRKAVVLAALVGTFALLAVPAFAGGNYQLKINLPAHAKVGVTYAAKGDVNVGPTQHEYVTVYVDTHKCANLNAEVLRAEHPSARTDVKEVLGARVVGHFDEPFKLKRNREQFHYMCGYLWHVFGSGATGEFSDRVVKLHFSLS